MTDTTPTLKTARPSRFWRFATLVTLAAYIVFLLAFLALEVVSMLQRGTPDLTLNAEEAAELAVAQADRILGLLEVVLGVVGLLLPLGLTVVVYIYNQSRATIKENEQTIEALSREARQARADADMSKAQVTALQAEVKAALDNLNAQMTKSSDTIAALGFDADRRAEILTNSIDQQRREAEQRDLEREAQMDRQQQDFEEKISLQVLQLQQLQQQVSVLDLILDIRSYEVGLLSDTYEDVQLSLNALIQYTYLDEEEDDGRQNTRRREAVHALGTFSYSSISDSDWLNALKLRAIQHLELIALDDMTPQVRYEARRVLRELNGEGSGTTKPTPPAKTSTGRGRPRKSPHLPDQPTQADD